MSLAWLRTHARNRDRRARSRSNSIRGAAQRAHRQFAGAEAYAPRVEYDNSFVVDRSTVTSKDANWLTDEQYKRQYRRLGWDVAPIRKDGNCLFRALSDQLYGHERRHLELRRRLVDFINLEQAFFEPFVAGEGVMEYCARLREAGAWGGHPELVAASRLLGVNIIVHTGPVKRLRIDTDKYAISKEGKGRTINLLLKHDHYSSLHKRDKPISQQHGCSDNCLCRRVVTPSRGSSISSRASLGARPSDLHSSLGGRPSDLGRHSLGARPDLDSRDSFGSRPADNGLGSDKRARSPMGKDEKNTAGKKNHGENSPQRKKQQQVPAKPRSRPPPPPAKPKTPAPAPPTRQKSSAAAVPAKPKTSAPAPPAKPVSAPPAKPQRPAPAPPAKPVSAPPAKPQAPAPAPPVRAKAPAPAPPVRAKTPAPSPPVKPKVATPAPPLKHKAASPRVNSRASVPTPPTKSKSAGVVLFQPESLAPVVKPKAPLVVLFEPETAPASKPAPTPVSKKTPVNTATPSKPKVGAVLEVEVEEPESISGGHDEMPECGVHRPRRAIFNGGRRRSSGAAFTLMQEMSISLNVSRPVAVADVKPKLPNARSVEVKKSSKKVFRQGRPVTAAC